MRGGRGPNGQEASDRATQLLSAFHKGLYKKFIFNYSGTMLIYSSCKELEHC